MNDVTVMLTACGNAYMHGICKSIKENGEREIRLVGADMNHDDTILQMCDTYYQVPKANDPSYVDSIMNICEGEHVDVLIPIMSAELEGLSMHKDKFAEMGTMVSISEPDSLKIANNKFELLEHINRMGLPCAMHMRVDSIDDIDDALNTVGTPCVFKLNEGSGSRGMRIVDPTRSRLDNFLNEKPNSLFTSAEEFKEIFCAGGGISLYARNRIFARSRILCRRLGRQWGYQVQPLQKGA